MSIERHLPDTKQNANKSFRIKNIEPLHVARGVFVTVVTVITVLVVVVRVVVTQSRSSETTIVSTGGLEDVLSSARSGEDTAEGDGNVEEGTSRSMRCHCWERSS